MRIFQIIPDLSGGGAERFVVDLSNELSRIGHEVIICTFFDRQKTDIFYEELEDKVKTISLGKRLGFDRKVFIRLWSEINRFKPDVIHNHLYGINYLLLLAPFRKEPIFHTVHNDAYKECSSTKQRLIRKIWFSKKWINPLTISENSNSSFKEAYRIKPFKLIPNGRSMPEKTEKFLTVNSEIEQYKSNQETLVFLNIGRLVKQKNQLTLIKVFEQLTQEENINAVLLIMGGYRDSEESNEVLAYLKQTSMTETNVFYLGEKENATDYLFKADFFVLSSLVEGLPITLLEALATGCIPISTPVGGVPEIVNQIDSSLLSHDTSPASIFEMLKYALELQDERRNEFKDKGRKIFLDSYSMVKCASEHIKAYKSANKAVTEL